MAEETARTFINSGQYAERLGAHPVVFRQAMAHKRGTLGSLGGAGYAPPGVRELSERIAPPTAYASGGESRPLWSLGEVEAFEAQRERSGRGAGVPVADGRPRRPAGLEGLSDAEVEGVLEDGRASLTEREAEILRARLGLDRRGRAAAPRRLGSVGEELGISRERVRQVEKRAVEKVREALVGGGDGAGS